MLFKFNSIYRQFSHISLRLITKKLINSTGNSLQFSSLTNSPLRQGKRGNNRIGIMALRPTPFGIVTIERVEPKLKYSKISTSSKEEKVSLSNDESEFEDKSGIEGADKNNYERSIDLMFPFLTGEELKAFDSSVYE
jgi:hypothetical protein